MIASIMPPVMPEVPTYQGWSLCIAWCEQNCQHSWRFISEGVFDFESESDYVTFLLRWS